MTARSNSNGGPRAPRSEVVASSAFWRRLAHAGARYGPEPWLKYSPALFGLAFAALLPAERRRVRDNLRRVLGRRSALEEQLDVARTFVSYAGCLAEALAVERPEVLGARRRFRDEPGVRRALAQPTGLVIVTAHVGAWDVAGPLLVRDARREVVVVMQPEADPGARRLQDAVRERAGVRVVHVGEHPLDALPLLSHLRRGGIVAAQLDRLSPGGRALDVELFGELFSVPEGPFALAALARVPVLPVFVRRVRYLDYELAAGVPIELPERPSPAELRAAVHSAVGEMERFIRAHPTQWFHFATGS